MQLDFAMFDSVPPRTPHESAARRALKAEAHSRAGLAYRTAEREQTDPDKAAARTRRTVESNRVGLEAALRTIGRDHKRGQRFSESDYRLAARLATRQIIGL